MLKYYISIFLIISVITGCSSDDNEEEIKDNLIKAPVECTIQNPTQATTTPLPGTVAQTCIDTNCNGECDEDEL